jgi:hypothetical protein
MDMSGKPDLTPDEKAAEETQANLVNGLQDDLYFYFRANRNERLKPPLDRRFIPLKRNTDKLLDVVIGSSTIYPIFPSRVLTSVQLGNEEKDMEKIERMSIVDGGYIHNIPIEAAVKWKATHYHPDRSVADAAPEHAQRFLGQLDDGIRISFQSGAIDRQARAWRN